jgi:high affinity Mn2+ porin
VEWYQGDWTLRGGIFDLSVVPNSTDLDPHFQQFQWIGEIEHRHSLWGRHGKIAITGFLTRGRMGRFEDAIELAQITGPPADITAVRRYTSRSGVSVNLEQELVPDVGFFARAGVANGAVEPYEFTDVDQTTAAGFSFSGKRWGRPDDTFGVAGIVNATSGVHQAFLDRLKQHGRCQGARQREGHQLAHAGNARLAGEPEAAERCRRGHGAEDHGARQC